MKKVQFPQTFFCIQTWPPRTNLQHTHLPPNAKKKKKETPQSILYYSIHRDEGVQEVEGGEGDLKDAWEAREIWEFTQQCSVSRSRKKDALQSCK